MQKFNEDFRQQVLLEFIERWPHLFHLYNPDSGDFFTFLYCYICTLVNSDAKKQSINSFRDHLNLEECLYNLSEKEIKYHRIDYKHFDVPKAPFARRQISPDDIKKSLKQLSLKSNDKKIIVLALKSSYYLTDEQIERLCRIYKIHPDYFYSMVQHCKDSIESKTIRREKNLQSRNFAYYHHKRYNRLIQHLEEDSVLENPEYLIASFIKRERKHRQNWNKLNQAFEKGHLYMRPTNKTIAGLMGICERQVNYYIHCAKKDMNKRAAKEAENS